MEYFYYLIKSYLKSSHNYFSVRNIPKHNRSFGQTPCNPNPSAEENPKSLDNTTPIELVIHCIPMQTLFADVRFGRRASMLPTCKCLGCVQTSCFYIVYDSRKFHPHQAL